MGHPGYPTMVNVNDYSAIQLPVTDAGNLSVRSDPVTETPRDDVTQRDTQLVATSQPQTTSKKKKKKKTSPTDSSSSETSPQGSKLEGALKPIPAKEQIIPSEDGTKHVFVQHADNFLPQVTNEDHVQHGQHISETAAF